VTHPTTLGVKLQEMPPSGGYKWCKNTLSAEIGQEFYTLS